MTLLTAALSLCSVVFPEWRTTIFIAAGLCAVGAAFFFFQALRWAARFTSDGLNWRTLREGFSQSTGYLTLINIHPGGELPQPLTLKITCTARPDEAWGSFYPDSRKLDDYFRVPARIQKSAVYIDLKEPKLLAPAFLAIGFMGDAEEIVVRKVERQL